MAKEEGRAFGCEKNPGHAVNTKPDTDQSAGGRYHNLVGGAVFGDGVDDRSRAGNAKKVPLAALQALPTYIACVCARRSSAIFHF